MFVVSVLEMREQASHPHMSFSTRSDRSSQRHNQQAIALTPELIRRGDCLSQSDNQKAIIRTPELSRRGDRLHEGHSELIGH
ncbi:MAG: hypothetical protein RMX65_012930 [Nostoc sp. DedQUE01]|nr:hypothetical protein [Nostoc sp. DedQUE11]MDZ8073312.1 hypothetical protein [Nostoc sp. DedQUE01]